MLFLLDLNINLLFSTFYTANTLPDYIVRLYHNPAILHLWKTQASVASEICLAGKEIDFSNRKIFVKGDAPLLVGVLGILAFLFSHKKTSIR